MSCIKVVHQSSIDPEDFIAAIWSSNEWEKNWNQTQNFIVDYDDGEHQSLRLRFNWHGKSVQLSVIRFRTTSTNIEFFCSKPPEGLSYQTGSWCAQERHDGMCDLIAIRHVVLERHSNEKDRDYNKRQEKYCHALNERLNLILHNFSEKIEEKKQ